MEWTNPEDYLQDLGARCADLAHVGFGFEDEQGQGGRDAYPQLFQEAEMEISEVNGGLCQHAVALLFLNKPAKQGTQPGTKAEKVILQQMRAIADNFVEQIRLEGVLWEVRVPSMLSLSEFGNDSAYGWRVELHFTYPKNIDRDIVRSRFTPRA